MTNVYNDLLNNVDKYLTKERYDMIMSMAQCEKEEMKLFRFAHVNDLINKGLPQMPNNLSKITFEDHYKRLSILLHFPLLCMTQMLK